MDSDENTTGGTDPRHRPDLHSQLAAIEKLLAIEATSLVAALQDATQHIAEVMRADKVDAFIYEEATHTLVALGTSDTPMGRMQRRLGLDRVPLANHGRYGEVFRTQEPYITGHSEADELEIRGIVEELGVKSTISVPLMVNNECRGVLSVVSAQADYFAEEHLQFISTISGWLGIVAHRAELVERLTEDALERGRQIAAKELITVLAHDLRNYLSPLKLRLGMMNRKAAREQRADDVRDIDDATAAVDRLNDMIGDLLDAGRLEDGVFSISTTPLDLADHAHRIAASLQIHETAIDVDAPEPVIVSADPDRIQQAVENLLSNAVKYSPQGKTVRMAVLAERYEERDWGTITVTDHGPGIAPEILPRLFQRFASGPNSSGLGLGLYVASRIAAAHGGTLTVDSSPGQSTTFRLSIPNGQTTLPDGDASTEIGP
jgi:two-component system, OmpR family, sensor kinase